MFYKATPSNNPLENPSFTYELSDPRFQGEGHHEGSDSEDPPSVLRPLILASSGGGGHLSAAQGLIETFQTQATIHLSHYPHTFRSDRRFSIGRTLLTKGIAGCTKPVVGPLLKALLSCFKLDYLPDIATFQKALHQLDDLPSATTRAYLDLLLDIYPAGHEFAAIFNALQAHDEARAIRQAVQSQYYSDCLHHRLTSRALLRYLTEQMNKGQPYTEIISTQPQALQALCQTIIRYNQTFQHMPITLHQYVTDLPTSGATHYLNALNRLSDAHRQQIHLILIAEPASVLTHFPLKSPQAFRGIHCLSHKNNPMIKAGFKSDTLSRYTAREQTLELPLLTPQGLSFTYRIDPHERVLSLMLGSQGGFAMLDYLIQLLQHTASYDHLFLLRGNNEAIDASVAHLRTQYPTFKGHIHCLGMQSDRELAPLMTRSDTVILRAGGLSTMEQLALPTSPHKHLLIHHPHPTPTGKLSTGLSWEDDNAKRLKQLLAPHKIRVTATCPARIMVDLV